ncbi:MAG: PmoA family protein [Candidatus Hydrogenedentes bacterium]|nr:PmoA family protein [Candidatus Hydrogenedentota bacterium]
MAVSAVLIALCSVSAALEFQDDAKALTLLEDGKPVYVYHYTMVTPPEGVDARYRRLAYMHPLYGLEGEVLTQDFPADHFHHRGVFWAWPECTVGDRKIDVWSMDGAHQVQEMLSRHLAADAAQIAVINHWVFDDAPSVPQVREKISITTYPTTNNQRAIDFDMTFSNVSGKMVTFLGAENKGYGGLCFRPDNAHKPMHFTTKDGQIPEDQLRYDTPWADVSFEKVGDGSDEAATPTPQVGVAIFQHPDNPGYPHPGWIFRHYSFLGVSWPHEQTHVLQPGESFTLKYRMLVHQGSAEEAKVKEAFEEYLEEVKEN